MQLLERLTGLAEKNKQKKKQNNDASPENNRAA